MVWGAAAGGARGSDKAVLSGCDGLVCSETPESLKAPRENNNQKLTQKSIRIEQTQITESGKAIVMVAGTQT